LVPDTLSIRRGSKKVLEEMESIPCSGRKGGFPMAAEEGRLVRVLAKEEKEPFTL